MWRATAIELSFPWTVSESGYEWRDAEGSGAVLCERNIRDARSWVYQPLRQFPVLFREFAELDGLEQIRRFADQYGVLFDRYELEDSVSAKGTYHSVGAASGTNRTEWLRRIAEMKLLVDLWDAIEGCKIQSLRNLISWEKGGHVVYRFITPSRRSWKLLARAGEAHAFRPGELLKPARYALQNEINDRLASENSSSAQDFRGISYAPRLLRRSDTQLRVVLRPHNLLSAMWLQFAQVVGGSYELRKCPICGGYFRPKRSDAITCDGACRQKKSRNSRVDRE